MIAALLVVLAFLALVFFVWLAKGRAATPEPQQLAGRIRPVDVEAFRNLMDPAEESYLRENLSPADFRTIRRERLRAALAYVFCVAGNAAILVRIGEAARHSPEPSIAQAGERLVESALRLRLAAFQAVAKIYLGILLPTVDISSTRLADGYESMTGLVFALGRLQHPARRATAIL